MTNNIFLKADSYKFSHYLQLPPGTTEVSAYIEARCGGRFNEVTFFGLQAFLDTLNDAFDVSQAEDIVTAHGLPFNRAGFERIAYHHDGYLPLEIQALPEGMTVPTGTPLVQLRNTDPELPWLTTFVETMLLRGVWYPSTVATLSRQAKKLIYAGLLESSDDPDSEIPFKLHDFGARGVTCGEQAALGGAAHMVNFSGSDTVEGIMLARNSYEAGMPAFSIPAAEHSTITAWGRHGETDAYRNMIKQFGGDGNIFAVVSDSYDIDHAVSRLWGGTLKAELLEAGGRLVVRPDSGDPTKMPVKVIRELERAFGSTVNRKGFKVLNPAVRVIQGDGMNIDTISDLIRNVLAAGFSIDNITFGMGGGLLQQVNRDTLRFAMKANEVVVNGDRRGISKAPVSDLSKASRSGRVAVIERMGEFEVFPESEIHPDMNLLQPVWRNGKFLRRQTFDDVRRLAALAPIITPAALLETV